MSQQGVRINTTTFFGGTLRDQFNFAEVRTSADTYWAYFKYIFWAVGFRQNALAMLQMQNLKP